MYGKIFESIFDSTLCSDGGWLPTYIFMSMVAIADKDGIVKIAPKALWRRLGFRDWDSKIQYSDFLTAIQYLESIDPESNTPDHEGKRIIPLTEIDELADNRGWLIVNYKLYRQKGSKMEPKGSSTDRVRRFRENQKKQELKSNETVMKRHETKRNGHTDTDTDTDTDININTSVSTKRDLPPAHEMVIDLYHHTLKTLPKVVKSLWKGKRRNDLTKILKDEKHQTPEFWKWFFVAVKNNGWWMGENDRGWTATLAWLVKPENFIRVCEYGANRKKS